MNVEPNGDRPEHSVAMWGAPTSGKTTFLAALSVALNRQPHEWKLVGGDEASTDKLIELTTALTRDKVFPAATLGIEHYRWVLVGPAMRLVPRRWRWLGSRQEKETIRIGLDLVDASGEISQPGSINLSWRSDLLDNLVRSRGIVFLFDPIREFSEGDAFDYTFGVLAQLASRMVDTPEFTDGWLPHHVAICITKFDEIRILRTADSLKLLDYESGDRFGFPRVDDEDARELFAALCDVSRSGNAELVLNTLERYFRPDRIKYFVTSAIGFHVDEHTGSFNPGNYQNQYLGQPTDHDKPDARIRGSIHPINIVEPLLWLARQLRPAAQTHGVGPVKQP